MRVWDIPLDEICDHHLVGARRSPVLRLANSFSGGCCGLHSALAAEGEG
jgi:hypothetical protein